MSPAYYIEDGAIYRNYQGGEYVFAVALLALLIFFIRKAIQKWSTK